MRGGDGTPPTPTAQPFIERPPGARLQNIRPEMNAGGAFCSIRLPDLAYYENLLPSRSECALVTPRKIVTWAQRRQRQRQRQRPRPSGTAMQPDAKRRCATQVKTEHWFAFLLAREAASPYTPLGALNNRWRPGPQGRGRRPTSHANFIRARRSFHADPCSGAGCVTFWVSSIEESARHAKSDLTLKTQLIIPLHQLGAPGPSSNFHF